MRLEPLDRRIVALAVPALGALVAEPLYGLTDTAIVGHLGRTPLAGLGLATAVLDVVVYVCGFLTMATTSEVAFRRGRGRAEEVAGAATAGYLVAVTAGTLLAVVVAATAGPLVHVLGAHRGTADAAARYLRVGAAGVPFMLVVLAGNGHLRGLSDTRTPLVVTAGTTLLNVALEAGLVYGLGFGIVGSAVGTVCAQVVGAVAFAGIAHARFRAAGVRWRTSRSHVARLARSGVVLVVRTAALLAALSGSTFVATRLGQVPLAAHQVAIQVWFLVGLSLDALAVPAQILVGEALGAGAAADARHVARRVLRWGVGIAAGLGAAVAGLSPVLPAVFTSDGAVRSAALGALVVAGLTLPVTAVAFMLDGVLLGAGQYGYLRRAMLLALLAFVPVAAVTLAVPGVGLLGVWAALGCWLAARAGILALRWRSGTWLSRPGAAY